MKKLKTINSIFPPVVSLSARNKNRIEKILSKSDITMVKIGGEADDDLNIIIKDKNGQTLIEYIRSDSKTDYKIKIKGVLVADMGWDTFVNVGPKGKRIFDTIDLIENKYEQLYGSPYETESEIIKPKNVKTQKVRKKAGRTRKIYPPVVPLTMQNKKKIESILKRKTIVISEDTNDENDYLIIDVKDLKSTDTIKYEMFDRTDYKLILNGVLVADMGWDTFVNVGPNGQRIFDTIDLIKHKAEQFSMQEQKTW